MCRTQGRRCPGQDDSTAKAIYNAKRRIARNNERAATARAEGDIEKAAEYTALATKALADLDDAKHERADAFRNSVIRDDTGALLTVHHGSATAFDTFDAAHTGSGNDTYGSGFYFTANHGRASGYGEHVKSVTLNITNPIVVDGTTSAHLDNHIRFSTAQAERIMRTHPRIYNQPDDDDAPNPLGDYSATFWDKDSWTRDEMNTMIRDMVRTHYDDPAWSSLEGVFEGGETDAFRRAVHDELGHDGVIIDFGPEGRHYVAWFPEQIKDADTLPNPETDAPTPDTADTTGAPGQQERCPDCGQYATTSHTCPQQATLDDLRAASSDWRSSWSDEEAEAFDTYSSIAHYDINAKLRGDNPEPLTSEEQDVADTLTALTGRAPRTTTPHDLSRGMQFNDAAAATAFADAHPVGATMTLPTVTSTTTSHATAEYFSGTNSEYAQSGVIVTFTTTQAAFTKDSAENEVLLTPGSTFTVTGRDTTTVNGKTIEHLHVTETTPAPSSAAHPLANGPATPVEFAYVRNPQSLATNQAAGHYFGQDIEPAGRYMIESPGHTPDGWEAGTVTFTRPLRIELGDDGYDAPTSWKQRLSAHYDGKTGKALSAAVRADGYDAIITSDKYGTSEVVDLTATPTPKTPKTPKASGPKWDRRRKYTSRDANTFASYLEAKHGIELDMGGGPNVDADAIVRLRSIIVPENKRGAGVGNAVMDELAREADRNGWTISLTPDSTWGSSVTRLRTFYRAHGFVPNKGRAKDYRTSDTFIRHPNA